MIIGVKFEENTLLENKIEQAWFYSLKNDFLTVEFKHNENLIYVCANGTTPDKIYKDIVNL